MGRITHTDICVRGQVFATIRAAAQHFGVTYHAVSIARQKGRLDTVGTGTRGARPMQVRIRDLLFEDADAAGAHFGVTANTIRTAVWRGTQDRIGLPRRFPGGLKPVPHPAAPPAAADGRHAVRHCQSAGFRAPA